MKATIDKAGRIVIPAELRKRAGLKPGTELDVIQDDICLRLIPSAPEPRLIRKGRRLVAKPAAGREDLPRIDLASLVEEERNRWPW